MIRSAKPHWADCYPGSVEPAWEVALLFPPQRKWTVEDYFSLTEGMNRLVELDRGNLDVLEIPTREHQRIVAYLVSHMSDVGVDPKMGTALFAPHQTTILPEVIREPDIVFKLREHLPPPGVAYFTGADLVIEVISPSKESQQRDYVTKARDYAAGGICEYWIIDPQDEQITVLALEGTFYVEHCIAKPGDVAKSKLLGGFEVEAAAVFAAGKRR